jgi:hypothetical protein
LTEKVFGFCFSAKEQVHKIFGNYQADKMQANKKSGMYLGD